MEYEEYRGSSVVSSREMLGKFRGRVYLEIAILGSLIRYRNIDIKFCLILFAG